MIMQNEEENYNMSGLSLLAFGQMVEQKLKVADEEEEKEEQDAEFDMPDAPPTVSEMVKA